MNLFDILSHDERIVVLSNVGDGCIFTWNRSLTLQWWMKNNSLCVDGWKEIGVRTLSDPPLNYEEARQAAMKWQGDGWKEEDENAPKPPRRRRKKATCKHPYLP